MSDTSLSHDPVRELEARVRALENENTKLKASVALAASLRDLLTAIDTSYDSDAIVDAAVTSFAAACALCAFGRLRGDSIEIVNASSNDVAGTHLPIGHLASRLNSGACVIHAEELAALAPDSPLGQVALEQALIVPIRREPLDDAVFVFAHDGSAADTQELNASFERGVALIGARLDTAELVRELKSLNDELTQGSAELRTTNLHLAEIEARQHSLIESAGLAYYVVDPDGRIIDASNEACSQLGYTRGELVSRKVWDVAASFDANALEAAIEALSRGDKPVREAVQRRSDGTAYPAELTLSLMQSDPEPNVLCLLRDVSERERLEQDLWQARKMESIGRLAGGIAHDFNNLLSTIIGHADLVLVDMADADPMRESVSSIKEAGNRAAELTQQLLAFSRKQALETKPISIGEVVSNLSLILRRIIGDDIDLDMDVASQTHAVMGDQSQLEQVVLNLVVNGRDAMPGGGRLKIATRDVEIDQQRMAAFGVDEPGTYVMLQVQDEGVGIPAEIQDDIFEPFFTTKAAGQGTGLGLSTTYGIVRQFHGGIHVSSTPNRGSTFEVVFPACPDEADGDRQDTANERLPTGGERLLIVDDHPGVLGMLSRMLARLGYSVLQASDGEEALRVIEANRNGIDLVVSDVVMPGMHGTKLAAEIESRWPHIKIMLMTGYAPDSLPALQSLKRRPRVLTKPISPTDLAEAIREVI
ncbi:MAG: response regulator, partial [Gammaproteobacteria bacterium]